MDLALFVGNTNIRYGFFSGEDLVESGVCAWAQLAAGGFEDLRRVFSRDGTQCVLAGTVREDRLEQLTSLLGPESARLRVARRDFELKIVNRCAVPAQVGTDRLLNAMAAMRMWPGEAVVAVDFGTALSVSVVSPQGELLGGLIGVGAGAGVDALRRSTPRLPELTLSPVRGFLQDNTLDAIRAGVFWQQVGGVERILAGLRDELPAPLHVVATGGDARLFAPLIPAVERIDAHLTLRGLRIAAALASG